MPKALSRRETLAVFAGTVAAVVGATAGLAISRNFAGQLKESLRGKPLPSRSVGRRIVPDRTLSCRRKFKHGSGCLPLSQHKPCPRTVKTGDYCKELRDPSLGQEWVGNGALAFVITGVYDRTAVKYGERGRERYVPIEAGCVAENLYLQAEALGLGAVSVGAFHDDQVREVILANEQFVPFIVMPIGHVR